MGSDNFFTSFVCGGPAPLSLSSGALLKTAPHYRAGLASSRQDEGIDIESPSAREGRMRTYGQRVSRTACRVLLEAWLSPSAPLTATQGTVSHLQPPKIQLLKAGLEREECAGFPTSATVLTARWRGQGRTQL